MSLFSTFIPSHAPKAETTQACENGACAQSASSVRPRYNISEGESAWTLVAYLPGVAKENLSITDEEHILTIRGERAWKQPEGWSALYRESDDAPFALSLEHEGEIDVEKISAVFADGVLTATLPKVEAVKPRKITIN